MRLFGIFYVVLALSSAAFMYGQFAKVKQMSNDLISSPPQQQFFSFVSRSE